MNGVTVAVVPFVKYARRSAAGVTDFKASIEAEDSTKAFFQLAGTLAGMSPVFVAIHL
ncbi:hypothetical protein D3C84_194920 [compost metagenome]